MGIILRIRAVNQHLSCYKNRTNKDQARDDLPDGKTIHDLIERAGLAYEDVKITYEKGEPETIEKDGMLIVVQSETAHVEMSDEVLDNIISTTAEVRNPQMNI